MDLSSIECPIIGVFFQVQALSYWLRYGPTKHGLSMKANTISVTATNTLKCRKINIFVSAYYATNLTTRGTVRREISCIAKLSFM